jgi:chromosomal replication initiation ATPase DnaA
VTGTAEAMVRMEDFTAVLDDVCQDCQQNLRHALARRLAARAMGSIEKLLHEVAEKHGMRVVELTGPSRFEDVVAARRDFARLARARGFALATIGAAMRRNHATVVNLLKGSPSTLKPRRDKGEG